LRAGWIVRSPASLFQRSVRRRQRDLPAIAPHVALHAAGDGFGERRAVDDEPISELKTRSAGRGSSRPTKLRSRSITHGLGVQPAKPLRTGAVSMNSSFIAGSCLNSCSVAPERRMSPRQPS